MTSLCAVLLGGACNTGLKPLIRNDHQALRRDRLSWVSQNYLRDYNLISDQLSGLNAITVPGYLVQDEDLARLSPLLNPDDDLLG